MWTYMGLLWAVITVLSFFAGEPYETSFIAFLICLVLSKLDKIIKELEKS